MTTTFLAVHPVLPARDIIISVTFFQTLGFTLLFQDSATDPRYAVVERDGAQLHLQWHDETQWAFPTDRPAFRFLVDDTDALFLEYQQKAAHALAAIARTPWARPANTPWGTREFHMLDPAGSSLQFYQPLPR